KGRNKDEVPVIEFRAECRRFAEHWLGVQRAEFMRLGGVGDWDHYYSTMSYPAEAQIPRELMKFVQNRTLYRRYKPVMWSVVEQTALAEAEVEYKDYVSDQVWVKFPVRSWSTQDSEIDRKLAAASVVIWTTTPWTIPGNRAISFSPRITYGLYEVTDAPAENWAKVGDTFVLSEKLAEDVFRHARVNAFKEIAALPAELVNSILC